jgi:hypothetical protein
VLTTTSSALMPLAGLMISISGDLSPSAGFGLSSSSASISVTSVECESFDSTGEGSTVAGYGEGGGARESLSEPVDALLDLDISALAQARKWPLIQPVHGPKRYRVRRWRRGRVCIWREGRL